MIDQLDQPNNFLKKLQSELNSIFDELTSIYDRVSKTKASDISRTYQDVIEGMAELMSSYWEIPTLMISSDLERRITVGKAT